METEPSAMRAIARRFGAAGRAAADAGNRVRTAATASLRRLARRKPDAAPAAGPAHAPRLRAGDPTSGLPALALVAGGVLALAAIQFYSWVGALFERSPALAVVAIAAL